MEGEHQELQSMGSVCFSKVCARSPQSCLPLWDPMDCGLPGYSGPWDSASKNIGVGYTPGDFPDPGIKPASLTSPALAGGFFTASTSWEAECLALSKIQFHLLSTSSLQNFSTWMLPLPVPEVHMPVLPTGGVLLDFPPWKLHVRRMRPLPSFSERNQLSTGNYKDVSGPCDGF